jgi:signal transduction histidine kinase
MDVKRLRLMTIVAPMLFLLGLEAIGIFVLRDGFGNNSLLRLLIIFVILTAGVVPFSFWVFATIERRQAVIREWNRELEAIVAARTREIERYSREMTTRVLAAQEEERKRMARELHDDTAQSLSTLMIALDLLQPSLPADDAAARTGFERIRGLAKRTLDEVRKLSHDLRPTILDDFGLAAALQWYADEFSLTYGHEVEVHSDPVPSGRLDPDVELVLFRIAQEALTNSGKHAEAKCTRVSLTFDEQRAQLVVGDNGRGFDPMTGGHSSPRGGLGLYGMRERAELIGASLTVDSAPGRGTTISVEVPLQFATGESASPLPAGQNGESVC